MSPQAAQTAPNAVVVGMGRTGLSVARHLQRSGFRIAVTDSRDAPPELAGVQALGSSVVTRTGGFDVRLLERADIVVTSPGVPLDDPFFVQARARGLDIVGDIELFARAADAPVVGITGTNGKSTVTTLIGEMCTASGRPTFVGGNLGTPLCDAVGSEAAAPGGLVVAELSSFQLERIEHFRAHVGVLLNVTDDHLDRYASLAEYTRAKGRLFATQRAGDFALVPSGDHLCRSVAERAASTMVTFGGVDGAVRRDGDRLVDAESGLSVPIAELGIRGEHNIGNACAAALAARLAGVGPDVIGQVLRSFQGLPHRMQHVAQLNGIDFYDDSKATNVGAAVAAINGFARHKIGVVLIAGGKDKGGSYAPLREALEKNGAGLVLIGEAKELIAKAFDGSPLPIARAADMREAVRAALRLARWGEAVLLAPACASFDMYRSYAHRGDAFRAAVLALQAVELGP
jgi:UDP-N-acetylmuramoylalanine--D-glutamate ligase